MTNIKLVTQLATYSQSDQKKSPNVYKKAQNDFTRKNIDFDTFTKIA